MRCVRIFTAVFLALLWVPSAQHCLLSAAFPKVFGLCCECDGKTPEDGRTPAPDGTCNQCVTLESGVNLAALAPTVAPPPVWFENDGLAWLMRQLAEAAVQDDADLLRLVPQWSPPPLHAALLTRAQPVRGPSCVA